MPTKSKYFEGNYFPAWVPLEMRSIVDLGELALPDQQIIDEANALIEILGKNIAIYRASNGTPRHSRDGLCSIYKSARLSQAQLSILQEAERRLKNYVIVAYENPLQRHEATRFIRE